MRNKTATLQAYIRSVQQPFTNNPKTKAMAPQTLPNPDIKLTVQEFLDIRAAAYAPDGKATPPALTDQDKEANAARWEDANQNELAPLKLNECERVAFIFGRSHGRRIATQALITRLRCLTAKLNDPRLKHQLCEYEEGHQEAVEEVDKLLNALEKEFAAEWAQPTFPSA